MTASTAQGESPKGQKIKFVIQRKRLYLLMFIWMKLALLVTFVSHELSAMIELIECIIARTYIYFRRIDCIVVMSYLSPKIQNTFNKNGSNFIGKDAYFNWPEHLSLKLATSFSSTKTCM